MTTIILVALDYIPGLSLRASEEAEILGIDETECGETGYDYVSLTRDVDRPNEHSDWLKEQSGPSSANSVHGGAAESAEKPLGPREGGAAAHMEV
jgi:Amt family ammonium transporter